jgi:hypothetical protein
LISGIYWDLVKIFDKAKTDEKQKDFRTYMEKYILFANKMPFQHICAESLRKYIALGKASNVLEFKNAYKILGNSKCFLVTSLIDLIDTNTLSEFWMLKDKLESTKVGSLLARFYYWFAPKIVPCLDKSPFLVRKTISRLFDFLARLMIRLR